MTITKIIKGLLVRTGMFDNTIKLSIATLVFVTTLSFCCYIYIKSRNERIRRLNNARMKSIREKQITKWEEERSEYLSNPDNKKREEKDDVDGHETGNSRNSKSKLSYFTRASAGNGHLNSSFSHLSTYKPSVSTRYPCKKCCG